MADRKATVLNPAGYQEQLPDTDNIILTLLPTQNEHGSNKQYVDNTTTALGELLLQQIQDLENTTDNKLNLYVLKAGSTMTGTLDWQTDGGAQSAYIQRTGDALFENVDINSDLSAANGEFSGDVTIGGDLSAVNGTFTGDISAINGNFTGDVSLAQITVDQINLRTSNAGADGFINTQNFQVDEPILTIKNTGPLDIEGNSVDIKGVTTIETSLRVGDFSDYAYFISGTGDLSGDLTVRGDIDGKNNLDLVGTATVENCNVNSFINCDKTVFVGTDAAKKIEINGLTGEIGGGADCFIDGGEY